jgi:dicarboxylate transporter 10
MCADGAKAPGQQFGYNHALDALARIYSEEGMRAFWKGLAPNIARSALMSELYRLLAERVADSYRCLTDCYVSLPKV